MKQFALTSFVVSALTLAGFSDVLTYQGSSRWRSHFFELGQSTTQGTTSYVSYYLLERNQGEFVDQLKIDAWASRNPTTGVIERWYYIDRNFSVEFGLFGRFGTDVGGAMKIQGLETTIPFRGTATAGVMTAFRQFPVTDYYVKQQGLDLTEISGSARLNRSFSGNYSLQYVTNALLQLLESRGYRSVNPE